LLYHYSEEDHIDIFQPRKHPNLPERPPMVWAIDKDRSPMYYFPRDCPRIAFWPTPDTTEHDRERYIQTTSSQKVIAIEGDWLNRIQNTKLYRYSFTPDHFTMMDEGAGYFVSYNTEIPLTKEPVGPLLSALVQEGIEIRIMSSLQSLAEQLPKTSFHYSMIRMRNAKK
jgi:hypothetical protein